MKIYRDNYENYVLKSNGNTFVGELEEGQTFKVLYVDVDDSGEMEEEWNSFQEKLDDEDNLRKLCNEKLEGLRIEWEDSWSEEDKSKVRFFIREYGVKSFYLYDEGDDKVYQDEIVELSFEEIKIKNNEEKLSK